jgi:hypothetical protein
MMLVRCPAVSGDWDAEGNGGGAFLSKKQGAGEQGDFVPSAYCSLLLEHFDADQTRHQGG